MILYPWTPNTFRPDRDQYIKILRDNVIPEKLDNFDKKADFEIDSLGQPYDYYSIMHYRKVGQWNFQNNIVQSNSTHHEVHYKYLIRDGF